MWAGLQYTLTAVWTVTSPHAARLQRGTTRRSDGLERRSPASNLLPLGQGCSLPEVRPTPPPPLLPSARDHLSYRLQPFRARL